MKIRNLLVAILAMSGTVVFAQEQRQIKEEGKTVFKPHWFIQAQGRTYRRRSQVYRSDVSCRRHQYRI